MENKMNLFKRALLIAACVMPMCSNADVINEVTTSGLLIKDTLETHRLVDENVGVTCYLNLPSRTLSIEDQSDVAMQCIKTSNVDPVNYKSGKSVFKSAKSWFFKSNHVDRIYDRSSHAMIYISYNKKMSGDNASSAISVVKLN